MQQMKKDITMYGPHSPFARELLNVVTSSIGNFIPYDWQTLIKALLKPGEYLQWTMWFHDIAKIMLTRMLELALPKIKLLMKC